VVEVAKCPTLLHQQKVSRQTLDYRFWQLFRVYCRGWTELITYNDSFKHGNAFHTCWRKPPAGSPTVFF